MAKINVQLDVWPSKSTIKVYNSKLNAGLYERMKIVLTEKGYQYRCNKYFHGNIGFIGVFSQITGEKFKELLHEQFDPDKIELTIRNLR